MNEYYTAELDNFKKGWISYPFRQLEKGSHTLSLKAFDSHNNPSEAEIMFFVTDKSEINITELLNYPNPISDHTTFKIKHNRSREDLYLYIEVLSQNGKHIASLSKMIDRSEDEEEEVQWNLDTGNSTINTGVYVVKCRLKSFKDGSETIKSIRVFVTNKY